MPPLNIHCSFLGKKFYYKALMLPRDSCMVQLIRSSIVNNHYKSRIEKFKANFTLWNMNGLSYNEPHVVSCIEPWNCLLDDIKVIFDLEFSNNMSDSAV